MTKAITKAVIPAAGLGTRFLPATKAVPKEMLPVVDTPAIQYIVEEAVRAGIEDIVIVTSRGKDAIENHFDRSPELEAHLENAEKKAELDEIVAVAELADVHFVRQKQPRGFGDAVLAARRHVGDEPFVVMVGDEIVPEATNEETFLLAEMMAAYQEKSASIVAVTEVGEDAVSSYGIVDPTGADREGPLVRIRAMVEKPSAPDAPSRLASRGRYAFTPDLFAYLQDTKPGSGGEIQLTDAINAMAAEGAVYAFVHEGPILDVGKKQDYLRASIELALRRSDLSADFTAWLRERVRDL